MYIVDIFLHLNHFRICITLQNKDQPQWADLDVYFSISGLISPIHTTEETSHFSTMPNNSFLLDKDISTL